MWTITSTISTAIIKTITSTNNITITKSNKITISPTIIYSFSTAYYDTKPLA